MSSATLDPCRLSSVRTLLLIYLDPSASNTATYLISYYNMAGMPGSSAKLALMGLPRVLVSTILGFCRIGVAMLSRSEILDPSRLFLKECVTRIIRLCHELTLTDEPLISGCTGDNAQNHDPSSNDINPPNIRRQVSTTERHKQCAQRKLGLWRDLVDIFQQTHRSTFGLTPLVTANKWLRKTSEGVCHLACYTVDF